MDSKKSNIYIIGGLLIVIAILVLRMCTSEPIQAATPGTVRVEVASETVTTKPKEVILKPVPEPTPTEVAQAEAEQQQAIEAINDSENDSPPPPPVNRSTKGWHVVDKSAISFSGNPENYILQYPKISNLVDAAKYQNDAKFYAKIVRQDLADGMNAPLESVILKDSYLTDTGFAYRFEVAQVSCDYRKITVDPSTKKIHEQYLDCG